ncbi:hypothetical protein [Amycolatopsis sp. DG1A-15b]|nr:hypothetical protein [Amycolatopsis sp. DG1A-15b]WIX85849.1 hypothetical protein QRY02_32185 [Amycolatopsis sp. DG1A-15b]
MGVNVATRAGGTDHDGRTCVHEVTLLPLRSSSQVCKPRGGRLR